MVRAAVAEGLAGVEPDNVVEAVREAAWWPAFCPVDAV